MGVWLTVMVPDTETHRLLSALRVKRPRYPAPLAGSPTRGATTAMMATRLRLRTWASPTLRCLAWGIPSAAWSTFG
jgi:hypothetical protein